MSYIGNTNTTQAFTPAIDYFSGNGSTTAFTLSRPVASVAQVQVTIDNVAQNPSSAFTVSANTITFTSAPLSGTNNIYVYYTSPITQVIAPGQNTVYPTSLSTTNALYWDTSANVGIGTTSPTAKLDVSSSSAGVTAGDLVVDTANKVVYVGRQSSTSGDNAKLVVRNRVGDALTITGDTSPDGTGLYRPTTSTLGFTTAGTERMRITSSGSFRFGTIASDSAFFRVENPTNSSGIINLVSLIGSNANNTSSYHLIAATGGADKCYILGNGNLQNVNNSYGALSDVKLKENIVDATPKLANLMQVKVRNYNLKSDPTHKQIGVIAQELEQVFPSMIEESPDRDTEGNILETTTKAVKYSVFVPMLIKAIQELKAINDTQAETINALTARIVALESKP